MLFGFKLGDAISERGKLLLELFRDLQRFMGVFGVAGHGIPLH